MFQDSGYGMVGGFNRTFEMAHFRLELGKKCSSREHESCLVWCVKGEPSMQLLP